MVVRSNYWEDIGSRISDAVGFGFHGRGRILIVDIEETLILRLSLHASNGNQDALCQDLVAAVDLDILALVVPNDDFVLDETYSLHLTIVGSNCGQRNRVTLLLNNHARAELDQCLHDFHHHVV